MTEDNNPWLSAAIELSRLVKQESPETQQAMWEMNRGTYNPNRDWMNPNEVDDFKLIVEHNLDELPRYEGNSSQEFPFAYQQFLDLGLEPDVANDLAGGEHSAICRISSNVFDSLRMRAVDVFDELNDQGYWDDTDEYLCNEVDSVGFPEGQILPHCNGDADLCGELSAAYHLGEPLRETGNETLDSVCDRLSEMDGYGQYGNYYEEEPETSVFDNGSGGMFIQGSWYSADEARGLYEDGKSLEQEEFDSFGGI